MPHKPAEISTPNHGASLHQEDDLNKGFLQVSEAHQSFQMSTRPGPENRESSTSSSVPNNQGSQHGCYGCFGCYGCYVCYGCYGCYGCYRFRSPSSFSKSIALLRVRNSCPVHGLLRVVEWAAFSPPLIAKKLPQEVRHNYIGFRVGWST